MTTQVLDCAHECRCSRWLKRSTTSPTRQPFFLSREKPLHWALFLPNLQEQYFSIAINGIEKKAIENNYNVLISQSHDDPKREKQIVETMRRNRVDGIIVSVSKNSGDYKHFQDLEQFNIPVVFF
jgi:LacI family transcriptional regulator